MEEGETVSIISRKELRKQKLMEYLAAKGKLKQPTQKPYLRDECQVKKPATSALKVVTEKENEEPANRFHCVRTKVPTLTAQSILHPARGPLGVTNKGNAKGSMQIGRQKTNCQSEMSGRALPKHNENLVLTKRYTVVSSKRNTITQLKKQSNTGIISSSRPSSNASQTAVTRSNIKFSDSSNVAWSCPMKTVSDRISLGPLVKTKTGLIPAVTQPRCIQRQTLTHTSAKAVDTTTVNVSSVASKVRCSTSTVSVSKRSAMSQRKTLPLTTLNNPVNEATTVTLQLTARAGINVNAKSNYKPLLSKHSQPSCKSLPSSRQKTTSNSTCTTASNEPEGRAGMSKRRQSNGLPTGKLGKQNAECEGEKKGQQCRFNPPPSLGPSNASSSKKVSGVMRADVAEPGRTIRRCKEADSRKSQSSANVLAAQRRAPLMSQTAPQPPRTVSRTGVKTTKIPATAIPQSEGKKLTAAQEERMRKLKEWREAKGISYKRPPMPAKPQVRRTVAMHQPFWTTMKEEDEANSLICAVDHSLADCIKLLGEGCPPDQVKAILSRLPVVSKKFAKYWICQARLMEREGNLDVLPLFEEAVSVVLEPVDELRTVVFEILKKKDEIHESDKIGKEEDQVPEGEGSPDGMNNPMMTPKPVRALICGEKGESSVVKYKITATPGGPAGQQCEPARVNGQEVRFFTPVRRSVRIERATPCYPASLQDHDVCVSSFNDLISMEEEERRDEQEGGDSSPSADNVPGFLYVYRQNEALKDKVSMQLISEEAV